MHLVPSSPALWAQYASWRPPPPAPKRVLMIASDEGALLVGCCVYETDAQIVLFQGITLNPALPDVRKSAALRELKDAIKGLCTIENKFGLVQTQDPWIAERLRDLAPAPMASFVFVPGTRPPPVAAERQVAPAPKTTPAPPPEPEDDEEEDAPPVDPRAEEAAIMDLFERQGVTPRPPRKRRTAKAK